MKNAQKKTYTFRGPLELEVIMMQDMKTQGYTDKSSYIRDCIMKSANSSGGSRKQKQRILRSEFKKSVLQKSGCIREGIKLHVSDRKRYRK